MLDGLARRYGVRPSDLLHSDWLDYQFDVACALAGVEVKSPAQAFQKFGKARKMKIPESGVW